MNSKRGGTLVTVLIILLAMGLISGAVIRTSYMELRMNKVNLRTHEARNAAEALQEYATADVIKRFQNDPSLDGSDLRTAVVPVAAPSSATALFAGSNVLLGESEIVVSDIGTGSFGYVPAGDDRNDPLAGKYVYTRSIAVLAKAAVSNVTQTSSSGIEKSYAYAYQEFELRDAPLFTHAIFYNMDLVISPYPNMHITGPVHTNGNLGLSAKRKLTFSDKVSAGGRLYAGHRMTSWDFHGGSHDASEVTVVDDTGKPVSLYRGSGNIAYESSYDDSRQNDWKERASQKWGGMLQDSAHGVPILNPVSISDYVPDDPYTSGTNELENHAYALLEPLLASSDSDRKSESTRAEKFAMKAGLILKVEKDTSHNSGYKVRAFKYKRTEPNSLTPDLDIFGDPTLIEIDVPTGLIGDAKWDMASIETDNHPEKYYYNSSSSELRVQGGWYDRRQRHQLSILSLNIGRLKTLVESSLPWDDSSTSEPAYLQADWNGVVYIEFPIVASSGARPDKIRIADIEPSSEATGTQTGITPGLALALINGKSLPKSSFLTNEGLTIATNGPVYMLGPYNADNDVTDPNSATATDSIADGDGVDEVPAAVAADTVTFLSESWRKFKSTPLGNRTGRNLSHRDLNENNNATDYRAAYNTEWAMGLITGYILSDPTTVSSTKNWGGGVQNLPRFLEAWKNATATYRGSLVSIYESEVQDTPYTNASPNPANSWFRAPTRNWGFSDLFAQNKMPPGIPSVRHPRVTNLAFIDESDYNTLKNSISNTGSVP